MIGKAEPYGLASALQAENKEQRGALRECAGDWEDELTARYGTPPCP
jgi:hypothetical protein